MEKEKSYTERKYFDSEGNEIDPKNVYFRQKGDPFFLTDSGEMTREPLVEEYIQYDQESDILADISE